MGSHHFNLYLGAFAKRPLAGEFCRMSRLCDWRFYMAQVLLFARARDLIQKLPNSRLGRVLSLRYAHRLLKNTRAERSHG
jgi:hypothetical protein